MNRPRSWQSWFWFFATRGALIYLGLILLAVLLQRHLIYFPSRAREDQLLREAAGYGLHPWRDSENRLIGWRSALSHTIPKPLKRMVVFHGNAGFALHRNYYVSGFHSIPEGAGLWEVFLFEYPGYGARPGSPKEETILTAARQAMADLLKNDSRPIYLLGESLGSSFAARLAAENPHSVSGLFLITPLTCLGDVAARHYRFLPVRLLLREHHNVLAHLSAYPGPVAFLLAGRDEVIPAKLGEKLYRQYAGRKKIWEQPLAGHNTLDLSEGSVLWQEVADFLQ